MKLGVLMRELLHRNPAPDKTQDSLTWVQHMNSLKTQAEEIVLSEIVYSIGCGQAGLMESACSSQSSFCGFLTRQNNDSRFVKNTIHEPSKQR